MSRAAALQTSLCTIAAFALAALARPAHAVTFVVDSRADAVDAAPGDGTCATAAGECTLRAAIQEANALPGADAITLPAGKYALLLHTPGVDGDGDVGNLALSGDLDIRDDVTLTGAGAKTTLIVGNRFDRVFEIVTPANAHLDGITIAKGLTGFGGGLYVQQGATLHLTNSRVTGNHARYISDGSCEADGGGLENDGTLEMVNVSVDRNHACSTGGGLVNYGSAALTNVSMYLNGAARGGGINNGGSLTLTNATLARNSAKSSRTAARWGAGGALANVYSGTAQLTNVTVAGNSENNPDGGAIDNIYVGSGWIELENTIVAGNTRSNCRSLRTGTPFNGDKSGFMLSLGHNLDGTGIENYSPCGFYDASDLLDTNPLLARFDVATGVFPLSAGSPAIDAGSDPDCPATDQRGAPRPADGNGDSVATCDIGAYERQP